MRVPSVSMVASTRVNVAAAMVRMGVPKVIGMLVSMRVPLVTMFVPVSAMRVRVNSMLMRVAVVMYMFPMRVSVRVSSVSVSPSMIKGKDSDYPLHLAYLAASGTLQAN